MVLKADHDLLFHLTPFSGLLVHWIFMCYVYSVGLFLFKLCVLSIQHVGMNICSFKCALGLRMGHSDTLSICNWPPFILSNISEDPIDFNNPLQAFVDVGSYKFSCLRIYPWPFWMHKAFLATVGWLQTKKEHMAWNHVIEFIWFHNSCYKLGCVAGPMYAFFAFKMTLKNLLKHFDFIVTWLTNCGWSKDV